MYCLMRLRIWYYRRQAKIHYTSVALAPIGTSKNSAWLRLAKRKYNRAAAALQRLDPSSNLPIATL